MQYDQIKELIQIFEHSDLNNMEVTLGNASVKLGRGMANAVEESSEAQMVQTAVKLRILSQMQHRLQSKPRRPSLQPEIRS